MKVRAVLVVSGRNEFVDAFPELPIKPVGIIELLPRRRKKFGLASHRSCESFCLKYALNHEQLLHANLAELGNVLTRWNTELVITYSVPVLPMAALADVVHGGLNVHHSYLPSYRGGNPLLWQLMDEKPTFGLTVHVLSERADEGAVLAQCEIERTPGRTKQQLVSGSNTEFGVPLLKRVLEGYPIGKQVPAPQPRRSPTSSANHLLPSELLLELERRAVSLDGLWDVACFLSDLPPDWLNGFGWPSWFRWVPISKNRWCATANSDRAADPYRLEHAGMELHLTHADGYIAFAPRWHTSTFLYRLLT